MDVPREEHDRTVAFAELALGQIRALGQTASPRNFEIWYHYATGYNSALNQAINQTLSRKGLVSEADLDEIYTTHIASTRTGDRIDTVNTRALEEIKHVLELIGAARGSASNYSDSLADASEKLAGANDGEALRIIVERLVDVTKNMELNNRTLESRLSASKRQIEELQQNLEELRTESLTDSLTTLSNRKFFDGALATVMTDAKTRNEPLSLLMMDIDHFKSFNDKYGHVTGDQVLRLVALSIKQNVKGKDVAARFGGEEFVVALPNTSLQSAITVADHIRRAVMAKELVRRSDNQRLGRVTISIGAAVLRQSDAAQSLIERADNCLYVAKRNGRNRVICEADPEIDGSAAANPPQPARVA